MPYYVYSQKLDPNKNHEVHTETCQHGPYLVNAERIGFAADCKNAIEKAKRQSGLTNFDGCYHCCRECHRG